MNLFPSADRAMPPRLFYWVMAGRLLLLTTLLAGTYLLSDRMADLQVPLSHLSVLLSIAFFLTGLYALWYQSGLRPSGLTQTQTLADLALVTVAVAASGGPTSPFTFLYPLIIITASLMGGQAMGTAAAFLSSLLFGGLCWLAPGAFSADIAYAFFLNMAAFNVTAVLGNALVKRTSRVEERLSAARGDLRRLRQIQHHLADSLSSGLIIADEKGQVTLMNRSAAKILGLDPAQAVGQPLVLLWPEGAGVLWSGKPGSGGERHEMDYAGPDGTEKLLGIGSFALQDDKGETLGQGLIFQDITEVRAREDRFARVERLASLGEMAAGLAHEIRNPLASLSGSVQFLAESGLVLPEGQRLLSIMSRESNRMNELTESFLLYARPGRHAAREVQLREELDAVLTLLEKRKDLPSCAVKVRIPDDLVLTIDPDQLRQVLFNLLLNAYKALPQDEGRIVVEASREGEAARLRISDNGVGIAQATLARIFDPFFTTRPDGTGLGLSIVHSMVNSWGGDIEVESQEGHGTTFLVTLPFKSVEEG